MVAGLAMVVAGLAVLLAAATESSLRAAAEITGAVTAGDLRTARFPITWRGYAPDHVDAMLGRAAAALDDAHHYGRPEASDELPAFLAGTRNDRPQRADHRPRRPTGHG